MNSYIMGSIQESFDMALMDENLPNISEWVDNAACDDSTPDWIWYLARALEKYQQYLEANG